MRFIIGLLIAAACFGQGKQNVIQTGIVDAHGANWRFPEGTFAGLPTPAANNTGWRYTVTDCLTSACTAGACKPMCAPRVRPGWSSVMVAERDLRRHPFSAAGSYCRRRWSARTGQPVTAPIRPWGSVLLHWLDCGRHAPQDVQRRDHTKLLRTALGCMTASRPTWRSGE